MSGDAGAHDEADRDLAAEFVLGVLDDVERAQCEARRLADPVFARQVEDWERRLAPLLNGVAPAAPPRATWARIEGRIAPGPARREAGARWWNSLPLWRGVAAASLALAAACIALLVAPARVGPAPVYVATLMGDNGAPAFSAWIDPRASNAVLSPLRPANVADLSHELWLILPNRAPIALGVFTPGGAQSVALLNPAAPGEAPAQLAVSLEPPGGSPTGQPTGSVIAHGVLQKL
jgi:anti-sigma-K factor RskA